MLMDEDAHQFGYRDGGMGIVELDCSVASKQSNVADLFEVAADNISQRSRGEKVFLPKSKFLTLRCAIVGIKDSRKRVSFYARDHSADMVTIVESGELNWIGRARAPQSKNVGVISTPPD